MTEKLQKIRKFLIAKGIKVEEENWNCFTRFFESEYKGIREYHIADGAIVNRFLQEIYKLNVKVLKNEKPISHIVIIRDGMILSSTEFYIASESIILFTDEKGKSWDVFFYTPN